MSAAATLLESWREWPVAQKRELLARLHAERYSRRRNEWKPYPWQTPPAEVVPHGMWLMLGGRGIGKTDGAARYMDDHVNGPPCDKRVKGGHRMAIVAPTMGDAAESCVQGPSGLMSHNPGVKLTSGLGGAKVVWPGGAEARIFGAYNPEDVERLRAGGNRCLVWLEELAAMRRLDDALKHTRLGLRIGHNPHFVASTTPKPVKPLRTLLEDPRTLVTRGKTSEAFHLDTLVRDALYELYAGTRLGLQELEGQLLDDVEGAMWQRDWIEEHRIVRSLLPPMKRIVVAVDPAMTMYEGSDETGIIAAGRGADGLDYVLADASGRASGMVAAQRAWMLWHELDATEVVYEANGGSDWIKQVMVDSWNQLQRDVDGWPLISPPLVSVYARWGKQTRAEPIAARYEQGRVWHVMEDEGEAGKPRNPLDQYEDQLLTWVPSTSKDSPDRLDAGVHALQRLRDQEGLGVKLAAPSGRIPRERSAVRAQPSLGDLQRLANPTTTADEVAETATREAQETRRGPEPPKPRINRRR